MRDEVGARGLHVALAERQAHALARHAGNGHATAGRVQADDVAHDHVAAEIAGAPDRVAWPRSRQADQRGAHPINRGLEPWALGLVNA